MRSHLPHADGGGNKRKVIQYSARVQFVTIERLKRKENN